MKILVCGGRTYSDKDRVKEVLDPYLLCDLDLIIEGGAFGADRLARFWARSNGVHVATVDALWSHYGNSAGPRRNIVMAALVPDLVIAFPGGAGTENMIIVAENSGLSVKRV